MAPVIVLIAATLLARVVGRLGLNTLQHWPTATRMGLAVMFCFTASAHFNSMRADLLRMVPPAIPNPDLIITFTGLCEVLGAVGLVIPRTQRLAATALIMFLIAVLPANIHAARSALTLNGAPVTPLWPRVALQMVFIWLVWWSALRWNERTSGAAIAGAGSASRQRSGATKSSSQSPRDVTG
jgi:uncharacterized membrane protein